MQAWLELRAQAALFPHVRFAFSMPLALLVGSSQVVAKMATSSLGLHPTSLAPSRSWKDFSPTDPQNGLELALGKLVLIPESVTVVPAGEVEFMPIGQLWARVHIELSEFPSKLHGLPLG